MLVYRNTERRVWGSGSKRELCASLADTQRRLEALLRAAELECALEDSSAPAAPRVARLCDALARALLGSRGEPVRALQAVVSGLELPEQLTVKIPEGYAYYDVSPVQYAALTGEFDLRERVLVVGVRSIGTSLSACVTAALQSRGRRCERFTVRPSGHPWDRTLELSERARRLVEREGPRADFVIVDEGPGMSGSTFLAVAEALERCGVSAGRIHCLCSHAFDAASLVAPHAAERCSRYRFHAVRARQLPGAARDWSGGAWRADAYAASNEWPVCFAQCERVKWFEPHARSLLKFEGLPPYGDASLERAQLLAAAGYGPAAQAAHEGFVRYAYLSGRPARAGDLRRMAGALAEYCAFRARAFAGAPADPRALDAMLRCNVRELLGVELPESAQLPIERAVVPDARMQPHEWRVTARGELVGKTDGHGDGDAHLLPGPTDSAWDVAACCVEWQMSSSECAQFVELYARRSGDRLAGRLPRFIAAYCALRCGELDYAAKSGGPEEAERVARAVPYYRAPLERALCDAGWTSRTDPSVSVNQPVRRV